ncbi:MAG: M28 family peptidase [Anaerolineae bacterium]
MSSDRQLYLDLWLEHIRTLAGTVGPRGSTTRAERRASAYCARVLADLHLTPRVEGFRSPTSLFLVHFYVGAVMLLAFLIYPLGGRISAGIALALALLGMYSEVMELLFRPHPLRALLPRGTSQNVIATLPPAGEHRQDLILIGHVDTNHSPLIFRSPRWINAWRVTSTLIFHSFGVQIIVFAAGLITQASLTRWLTLPGGVGALLLVLITLEAQLSPFSPGANDNATGAGLVLTLAARLRTEPPRHTRVWFVNTGCEEVKHYGAIDFFQMHAGEMRSPSTLVFEMLGRDGPAWLLKEGTIGLFTYRSSPELVALCEDVARQHPDLGAHSTQVGGGHTEMADALRIGIPAITLIGLDEGGTRFNYDGPELYWHHIGDTPDKINPEVLGRSYDFTLAFIRALDARAAAGTPGGSDGHT